MDKRNEWVCVSCGHSLGVVLGGEYHPSVEGQYIRTYGPNLSVVCPSCGATKVWYTSDPVVRAIYQLVNSLSSVAAQSMITQIGKAIHTEFSDDLTKLTDNRKQ